MSAVLSAEAETLNWVPLRSSNVAAVAYSDDFARLYVRFKSGHRYAYERVPKAIFEAFKYAPSAGQFLWAVVRAKGSDSVYAYSGPF